MRDQYNNCNFYGSGKDGDIYIDFTTIIFIGGALLVGWLVIEGIDATGSYLAMKMHSLSTSAKSIKDTVTDPDIAWYLKGIGVVSLPLLAGLAYLEYRFRLIISLYQYFTTYEEDTFL